MDKEYLLMDDFEIAYEHSVEPEPEEVSDAILEEIIEKYHLQTK